jgi:phosphate starvation-inducible PhoH-like protein
VTDPGSGHPQRAELEVDGVAMVRLLGPQDRLLATIEQRYPQVTVLVRGNHVTIEGPDDEVRAAERLVQELVAMVKNGVDLGETDVTAGARILERGEGSPADVLSQAILTSRGKSIRPKTLGQKAYVDAIDHNTIVFGIGPAGTGKTYLAMAKAVQALQRKEVERIILSRPAINDKIDPYLRPLYDALNEMMDPEIVPKLLAAGTVEVAPLAYMRGRTLNNAFVVLDEAQNTTPEQMKMFLTRLGFGTRMVVTGDITQVDLPIGASGLQLVSKILNEMDDIHFARLTSEDVVRHSLVGKIVDRYTAYDAQQQARRYERENPAVVNPDGANRAERRGHGPQDRKQPGPEKPRRRR